MRRFWVDRSCIQGQRVILKETLFHHICRVSKIQKGQSFELFAEGVQKYIVTLDSVSHNQASAKIIDRQPVPPLKKPYIHLALCIPRLPTLDFIVEKAVELGVKELHLLTSSFSLIKAKSKFTEAKMKRLERIVRRSLAISGRSEPLKIHPICLFKNLKVPKDHRAFMAYEEETNPAKQILDRQLEVPKEIWLFVGSEGGFTPDEASYFSQSVGSLISFGQQILRVETACLVGLSILKYHYQI